MIRMTRSSVRFALPLLALSTLLLAFGTPAAAAPAGSGNCGPSLAFLGAESAEAVLFGAVPMARGGGSLPDPGAETVCTAYCANGTTRTCYGTSCNAQDTICYSVRGQCWGSSTGTLYCPPILLDCPIVDQCDDPTLCVDKDHTSCSGSPRTSDCAFEDGSCGSCFCNGGLWTCTL